MPLIPEHDMPVFTPEEFGDIVIKALPSGEVLRLKEIAEVELGDEAYNYRSQTNGHPGALFMVYQTAGSNATEVIEAIDSEIGKMAANLPSGVEFGDVFSSKDFLDASMHQVIKTLFEAFFLVVLIVFVFLQDVKSVIIPAISIMVSLVGTFIVMAMIGFSINLLTLFALVLAIGIPLRSLRKFPCAVLGTSFRAFRSDGQFPVCKNDGTGE